jgi:hypothetical protein
MSKTKTSEPSPHGTAQLAKMCPPCAKGLRAFTTVRAEEICGEGEWCFMCGCNWYSENQ